MVWRVGLVRGPAAVLAGGAGPRHGLLGLGGLGGAEGSQVVPAQAGGQRQGVLRGGMLVNK